jgi:RNA polymerase sigma factor (sigma-70 family)
MDAHNGLAAQFEAHRTHLRAMAYRLLGSVSEADDAVQETWLRLSRADTSGVVNLGGWLTTVVARICLNMLHARRSRREEPLGFHLPDPIVRRVDDSDPEAAALRTDAVGLALLVVLDTLTPAERLAFVLHDLFAMSFTEVAAILGRSVEASRQLASRARRRVRGAASEDRAADLARQREAASAFIAAARGGDLASLISLLDTDVTLTADAAAVPAGRSAVLHGAEVVARGAILASSRAEASRLALVDANVGIVYAPDGQVQVVLVFTVSANRRITAIDVIADPDRLSQLRLAVLPE